MITHARRVIHLPAEDSPNVERGLRMREMGLEPDGRDVIPGLLSWAEYCHRLATWDADRIAVGIKAQFWRGEQVMLFPQEWVDYAVRYALSLDIRRVKRKATAGACDSGEGRANTSWCAVDEFGIVKMRSEKTPDTSVIPGRTVAFCREFGIPFERFAFDRGGGGKQHADVMRANGYPVRTIAFGEAAGKLQPKRGIRTFAEKVEATEETGAYSSRRAEMHGDLRERMRLVRNEKTHKLEPLKGFAIPAEYVELIRQMRLMPKHEDAHGRLRLPPKSKAHAKAGEQSVEEIIGHSPDELDALVMAHYMSTARSFKHTAGAA